MKPQFKNLLNQQIVSYNKLPKEKQLKCIVSLKKGIALDKERIAGVKPYYIVGAEIFVQMVNEIPTLKNKEVTDRWIENFNE